MSVRKVTMKSSGVKTTPTSTSSTLRIKDELLKWICERHATNGPLDRKLLRDKAMELATSFGVTGFKCSEAWLTVFLKKHGFSPSLTNCNGPTFPDYRIWIDLLRSLITQYRHKDLFNVDELVMYSDFFPLKRTNIPPRHQIGDVAENHEISRIRSQTRRIGILLCCNSSGTEKLQPIISHPHTMEKSGDETRFNNREATCTSDETFGLWLEKLNIEMSNSQRRILLLLSRERIRSLHNLQCLSNIKLVFLPKDFPTHLRPLRGDVFHSVKMTYRCRYVDFILHEREETRHWGTKEIVESIYEAWKDVPQELIVSSFQRTKFREDESFLKIQCPDWESLETGMSFRKFVTFDDQLSEKSNREILQEMYASYNNEHRYNLRNTRRETIELADDRGEISKDKAGRVKKIMGQINDVLDEDQLEKDLGENLFSGSTEGSSKTEQDREIRRDEEHTNSGSSELEPRENGPKTSEIAVETVGPEMVDMEAGTRSTGSPDMMNTSMSKIYETPEKRKILMDRCLRGMNFRDFVNCDDFDGNSSGRDDIKERDESSTAMMDNEMRDNFPGEAGPSGQKKYGSPGPSGNPYSTLESNDEEKTQNYEDSGQRILDAFAICGDGESRRNEENFDETNDNGLKSFKRSRTCSGIDDNNFMEDNEPTMKRARSDGNWSKCYETRFAFGADIDDGIPNENLPSSLNENEINTGASTSNRPRMSQTESDSSD